MKTKDPMKEFFYDLNELIGIDSTALMKGYVFAIVVEFGEDSKKYSYPIEVDVTKEEVVDDPMIFFNRLEVYKSDDPTPISHEEKIQRISDVLERYALNSQTVTKFFGDSWVARSYDFLGMMQPIIQIGKSQYIKHPNFNTMVIRYR